MSGWNMEASGAAYDINAMLKACILACDSVTTIDDWNGDKGIERTLMVAERLMGDLIDKIEALERVAPKEVPDITTS